MAAVDLFTLPGQPGIDLPKQKALLICWLLLVSNSLLSLPQTRILKNDDDLGQANADGARPGSLINYLDLRDVQFMLPRLSIDEIGDIFDIVRKNQGSFQTVASTYWTAGESLLGYSDHYCLAVHDVLSANN